ncbi:archaetidylserine decarboxylase [Limnobacter sp.]|uniref:archaetidylserine decarboxylase n=1 Tax=Limnobacter sp. TaxID=2003368 RepID=UPI002584B18A|nr:archaetidylserine decarboxylase [Limnobacter sp.]
MNLRTLSLAETLNFAICNRLPRLAASRLMRSISRIEHPWFVHPALWVWKKTSRMDLSDSDQAKFKSIHDCFTRGLKPGSRPVAKATLVSPCDGTLGAFGYVRQGFALQIKSSSYALSELLQNRTLAAQFEGGFYATIRIKPHQYHRLHAPHTGQLQQVHWLHGDQFNINPPALKRIAGLFCRNERLVIQAVHTNGDKLLIIPVAAVLVGGIQLHAAGHTFSQNYTGDKHIALNTQVEAGQEIGWFEHGSTVIVISEKPLQLGGGLALGSPLKMGEVLAI